MIAPSPYSPLPAPHSAICIPPERRIVSPLAPGKIQILSPEISPSAFARAVGVSPSYVRSLCNMGKIECRRNPTSERAFLHIPVSEINRFLET